MSVGSTGSSCESEPVSVVRRARTLTGPGSGALNETCPLLLSAPAESPCVGLIRSLSAPLNEGSSGGKWAMTMLVHDHSSMQPTTELPMSSWPSAWSGQAEGYRRSARKAVAAASAPAPARMPRCVVAHH